MEDFFCSGLAAELFCLGFMRRAMLAAALVGAAAPSIGVYLVQRRLSLMGDGIGHVAFTGVAAGLFAGIFPALTALVAAVLAAVVIEALRARARTAGDVALAIVFYGGIAGGILLASLSSAPGTSLLPYLFGSVLTVTNSDLVLLAAACGAVLAATFAFRKELFAVTFDQDVAKVAGLGVRRYNLLISVMAAVTVAVAMRVVGILLVSAMLVLPVAAVQQLTRSFRSTVATSGILGLVVAVGGVVIAYFADVAPAATIVLSGIAAFVLLRGVTAVRGGA